MIELASHILDRKAGRFDASQFKDQYELALRKLVKRKASGRSIEMPAEREDRGNVVDLMKALRRSVKGRKDAALKTMSDSKKTTPARKRKKRSRKAA